MKRFREIFRVSKAPRKLAASGELLLFLVVMLALFVALPTHAQETPEGEGFTHIVQPGENLFRIAQRYGVTVQALAAANGIADQRTIYVGQELRIPAGGVRVDESGVPLINHTVRPGDTPRTLALLYGTTVERLAELNGLVSAGSLFIGQTLTVAKESHGAPLTRGWTHTVCPEDTLLAVAARYGVSPEAIALVNGLAGALILIPGQRLVIPAEDAPPLAELPDPVLEFDLGPMPVAQGQTVGFSVQTARPAILTGTFMDRPLNFSSADGLTHTAVFGVPALTARGLYPLLVFVREQDDSFTYLSADVLVVERAYGNAYIPVPAGLSGLLDASITAPENELLAAHMSAFNPEKYWDGLFSLPTSSGITSTFGVWRSYGGQMETYHAGVDFGCPPGAPILAPAAGRVVLADLLHVRGYATIIDHGRGVYTGYWHQSQINVAAGQMVAAGQVIGLTGNSGLSTGPHLHWEMWVSGTPVDPLQWTQQVFP